MFVPARFRPVPALFALAALLAAPACDDDPAGEGDPADAVVAIRITVGAQTVFVDEFGAVTGGPILVSIGNTAVTAAFLDENGAVVAGLEAEFQLNVTSANTGIATFTRTGAFTGNLVGVAVGQTTMSFELYHVLEGHADITFTNVPVTVAIIGASSRRDLPGRP